MADNCADVGFLQLLSTRTRLTGTAAPNQWCWDRIPVENRGLTEPIDAARASCEGFYLDPALPLDSYARYPEDCSGGCALCQYTNDNSAGQYKCQAAAAVLACPTPPAPPAPPPSPAPPPAPPTEGGATGRLCRPAIHAASLWQDPPQWVCPAKSVVFRSAARPVSRLNRVQQRGPLILLERIRGPRDTPELVRFLPTRLQWWLRTMSVHQ